MGRERGSHVFLTLSSSQNPKEGSEGCEGRTESAQVRHPLPTLYTGDTPSISGIKRGCEGCDQASEEPAKSTPESSRCSQGCDFQRRGVFQTFSEGQRLGHLTSCSHPGDHPRDSLTASHKSRAAGKASSTKPGPEPSHLSLQAQGLELRWGQTVAPSP